MANKAIAMIQLRQILRLHLQDKSKLQIVILTGVSCNSVKHYLRKFDREQYMYEGINNLTDHELKVGINVQNKSNFRTLLTKYRVCNTQKGINIMAILSENISQIISLSTNEKMKVESAFTPLKVSKGDLWIKVGKVCDHVGFVQNGKLRVFYNDDSGNEVTCYFVTPENFISSFTSFLTNTPTTENISAIEDSTLLVISKNQIEKLSDDIPKIHIWRRIIAENLFITMEKRIAMLQSQTANERYERMIKDNPDIVLTVPLQYTASFLGITPQHLSRLRKESIK